MNHHSRASDTDAWHHVSVRVPAEVVDAVSNFFIESGSVGVIEGAAPGHAPPDGATAVQGFFPVSTPPARLRRTLDTYLDNLSEIFPGLTWTKPVCTVLTASNWETAWRVHFPPVSIGREFLVLPPWERAPDDTNRRVIVIEPGMAFGTGHHATTQGCLEAIESARQSRGPAARALDLGTGSGILAIALATLGTREVVALDTDRVALEETRKNVGVNGVAASVRISDAPVASIQLQFPLIVANLFSSTLVELEAELGRLSEPGGLAILSGIQLDQEQQVREGYPPTVWEPQDRLARGEWVTLVFQRR